MIKTYRIEYKYCDYFLEYANFKDDLIECKCLCCNKICQQKFDEKLKEQFFNPFVPNAPFVYPLKTSEKRLNLEPVG